LHVRVLCWWKDRWWVSADTEVSGQNEVNQSRRCRAPIVSVDAARPLCWGGVPPQWSWPVKEDTGGCWGCLEAPVHTHHADRTQLTEDLNLCIQASTTTASKQNFRAGSHRSCAHDGLAWAWRTHAMKMYAHAKGFVDVVYVDKISRKNRNSLAGLEYSPANVHVHVSKKLHPFVCGVQFVRRQSAFYYSAGSYSVSKSESSSSSEVRNYDHHRWETNKQMRETNTPCVPFDVFLFYHWERCEKVDHVRHRGLKECVANRFSPRPYFAGLFRALQAPCGVASNS
jgi:hypothetical protein